MSAGTGIYAALAASLEREVAQAQEAFISLAELHLLCPAAVAAADDFRCVAEFAAERQWSFAFLPQKVIRFAPLPPRL